MSDSENTEGNEALEYFKISLQDMEKTIKFHEDELDAEDKRVEGTDEYPNYGDDFADMVYIARRISEELNNARYENNLLVQKCRELQERIDAIKHEVEAKENINSTLTGAFDALRRERDEARWEVCGFHHLTGFLAGDYAISRGWNYLNDERKWSEFPPSVKKFDEFLKAHSEQDLKTIERLREENRKLRELKIQGIVSEPQKATPPKYENLED